MPAVSSADRGLDFSFTSRRAMVAMGFIPFVHVAVVLAPILLVTLDRWEAGAAAWSLPLVYLLPPLAVRVTTWIRPLPEGRVDLGSSAFLLWWFTAQWQVVFARLPFLEELLRLVPGLYSMWLRLWGARIGALVYWSPGVSILDRPLVRIGNRVTFGVGVRLAPHAIAPSPGPTELVVAPITIEDDVLVGGHSLLLPGCAVARGEVTPPIRSLHAFSRWQGGRRVTEHVEPFVTEDN